MKIETFLLWAWAAGGVTFALHHACEALDWIFVWRRERLDLGAIARNVRTTPASLPSTDAPTEKE